MKTFKTYLKEDLADVQKANRDKENALRQANRAKEATVRRAEQEIEQMKQGDEIIFPGYGYMAASNLALKYGYKPKFVDVDPNSLCINTICRFF